MIPALTADETGTIAAAVAALHRRDPAAMVALLARPVAARLGDDGGAGAFTGIAFDLLCRGLIWTGDAAAVERLCAASEARFGPQPWSILYRACLMLRAGDWAEAAALYPTAGSRPDLLWKRSGGCRSVPSPADCRRWSADPVAPPPVEIVRRGEAGCATLLAACDPAYLRRYAAGWIGSIARHAADCAVHLHLVDPAPDDIGWALATAAPVGSRLTLSTERHHGPDARAWYASTRFVRLAAIAAESPAPVLATDIDALFTRPLTLDLAGHDALLMRKRDGFTAHPWHAIQAGAIAVAPTRGGREFARTLARLATGIFAERAGRGLWFVDQNLLFAADRLHGGDARIGAFREMALPGGLSFDRALLD